MKPNISSSTSPQQTSAFQMYANSPKQKPKKKKNRQSLGPQLYKPQNLVPPDDDEVLEIINPRGNPITTNSTSPLQTDVSSSKKKRNKHKLKKQNGAPTPNGFNVSHVDESPNLPISFQQNGNSNKKQDVAGMKRSNTDKSDGVHKKKKKSGVTEKKDDDADHKDVAGSSMEATRLELDNTSSIDTGKRFLSSLIAPIELEEFLKSAWEKRPLVMNRHKPDYFDRLGVSSTSLDAMLRKHNLRFTKNLDVTSYTDGKRVTHNPPGRAMPAEVWDYYNEGCSVRWLNPQTYSTSLWQFCSALQEYFGCFVGANIYLTPPNSQGFAPHYDDIEAFILQLEGRKHWKLYKSSLQKDVLPRYSSGNYDAQDIGEPFLEVTLNAGDLLYFPRGTIHQAVATDSHSLHITLSCYQLNSWADLMEKLVPLALSRAIASDPALRTGLPIGHLNYVGLAHQTGDEEKEQLRRSFKATATEIVKRVFEDLNLDEAVDMMGKRFMQDALPPCLSEAEKRCSMNEDGDRLSKGGRLINSWAMDNTTMIKLTRAHCIRLISEDGAIRLYYTLDNTREYHEEDPGFFEITKDMEDCVRLLVENYPNFTAVGNLPLPGIQSQVEFAGQLWIKGLVLTSVPLVD